MRKIEEIREAFSKGHIVVGKRGVFVVYNNPPEDSKWISQGIDGNELLTFVDLFGGSDRFQIATKINDSVTLGFLSDKTIEGEFQDAIFPRIEEELTQEQIRERRAAIKPDAKRQQDMQDLFLKHFDGVDIKDEGAVLSNAANWLMAVMEYNKPDAVPFKAFHNWKALKQYAQAFYQAYPKIGEMTLDDPTPIMPQGYVEFNIACKKNEVFLLPDKAKDLFYKMLASSDCFGIDTGFIDDEIYINIDFYA